MTAAQLLTYEQYRQWPYDGRRTELVGGRVIELNDPTATHTNVIDTLRAALRADSDLTLKYQSLPFKFIYLPNLKNYRDWVARGAGIAIAHDTLRRNVL